jgi:hypothetical protein
MNMSAQRKLLVVTAAVNVFLRCVTSGFADAGSKPPSVDELIQLIGCRIDDQRFDRLKKDGWLSDSGNWGGTVEVSGASNSLTLWCYGQPARDHSGGLTIQTSTLRAITVYLKPSGSDHSAFAGALPYGIRISDSPADIRRKLGAPVVGTGLNDNLSYDRNGRQTVFCFQGSALSHISVRAAGIKEPSGDELIDLLGNRIDHPKVHDALVKYHLLRMAGKSDHEYQWPDGEKSFQLFFDGGDHDVPIDPSPFTPAFRGSSAQEVPILKGLWIYLEPGTLGDFPFTARLPFGIRPSDTVADIKRRLGTPKHEEHETNDSFSKVALSYDFWNYRVIFSFENDQNKLNSILVFPRKSLIPWSDWRLIVALLLMIGLVWRICRKRLSRIRQ